MWFNIEGRNLVKPLNTYFFNREEDMRNSLLSQILDQNARARCMYNTLECSSLTGVSKLGETGGTGSPLFQKNHVSLFLPKLISNLCDQVSPL